MLVRQELRREDAVVVVVVVCLGDVCKKNNMGVGVVGVLIRVAGRD